MRCSRWPCPSSTRPSTPRCSGRRTGGATSACSRQPPRGVRSSSNASGRRSSSPCSAWRSRSTPSRRRWSGPGRPPTQTRKAGSLAEGIRRFQAQAPGAAEPAVVERALAYAAELAATGPEDHVLVHGDLHPGNLLRGPGATAGEETGWCFVDPDPFVADRAYDVGVVVRDFSARLLADPDAATARLWGWCCRAAAVSGTDPARVWASGSLHRVSPGLYVTSFGARRVAEPFLRSAALLDAQGGPPGP